MARSYDGEKVFLSLGSNLGDNAQSIRNAIKAIKEVDGTSVIYVSDFYRTEPVDTDSDKWFLNCVVQIKTTLAPIELLDELEEVELLLGRNSKRLNAPRTIDIDILFYGDMTVSLPRLSIPHPKMTKRRFVLEPLSEIVPDFNHPSLKSTVAQLNARVEGQKVTRERFENTGL